MKTIRLNGDRYRVKGGFVQELVEIDQGRDVATYDAKYKWVPTKIRVGAEFVLCSTTYLGTDLPKYFWIHDGPVPGNSNPSIERYHGWRGTTDDRHIEAHGLRRVRRLRELKTGQGSVTLSDDLHPDWD